MHTDVYNHRLKRGYVKHFAFKLAQKKSSEAIFPLGGVEAQACARSKSLPNGKCTLLRFFSRANLNAKCM